jgi:hypothetical protein
LSLLIIEILVPAPLIACGPADALTCDNATVGWIEDDVVTFNNCAIFRVGLVDGKTT